MNKHLHDNMTSLEKKLGWFYWAFQLLILPAALPLLNDHFSAPLTETELNFLYFCLNFLLLTVLLHKYLLASCVHGLRRPFYTLQSAFLGLALYWLLTFGINWLIGYLRPDFFNLNDNSIAQMVQQNYTLTAIGTVLLAPVAEEILYRGVIFGTLYHKSRLSAYLISTFIFAAVHLLGYITLYDPQSLLLCLLQYLPAGLCLGWAYARSGSILAPILMHIAINQMGILSMR